MDLHVCIKIDDDAVNKIAKVITETVKRVTAIQQPSAEQGAWVPQPVPAQVQATASQAAPYNAQTAQEAQIPVQAMASQPMPTPVQTTAPVQPTPVQTTTPVQAAAPQTVAPMPQTAVPTAARAYTLDELASAAMLLMDQGKQVQLQNLLAGHGVASLPELPPDQYGTFATALRGMGAQI